MGGQQCRLLLSFEVLIRCVGQCWSCRLFLQHQLVRFGKQRDGVEWRNYLIVCTKQKVRGD